jgi:hypothetical protein
MGARKRAARQKAKQPLEVCTIESPVEAVREISGWPAASRIMELETALGRERLTAAERDKFNISQCNQLRAETKNLSAALDEALEWIAGVPVEAVDEDGEIIPKEEFIASIRAKAEGRKPEC